MRVSLPEIVLAVGMLAAVRPASGQRQDTRPDSSPPRVLRLTAAVEVPLVNAGSAVAPLPAVEVMVNGRGPFLFGIETGARFLIVTEETARRAGLGAPIPGGPPELHVDSITIGTAMLGDVHVTVLPRAPTGVDGLLGLPAFENVLLTIDYPHQRVRLERDSLPRADGRTILPLTRVDDFWALLVSYAGHPMLTIVDTRSSGAFALDPRVESILPWSSEPVVVGLARGAGIPTTEVRRGTLGGDVIIGQYRIVAPALTLHQLPPDYPSAPRIGAVVLSKFVVTLDQQHARLRLVHDGPSTFSLPSPRRAP